MLSAFLHLQRILYNRRCNKLKSANVLFVSTPDGTTTTTTITTTTTN